MNINFGETIARYRVRAHLTQAELGQRLKVSRITVNNWECNRSHPELTMLPTLCETLRIPPLELFGLQVTTEGEEQVLLERFRRLEPAGRRLALRLVGTVLVDELEQRKAVRRQAESRIPAVAMKVLRLRLDTATPLAAGEGYSYADEVEQEFCTLRETQAGSRADAVMRVKGRSMEPLWHDGDLVYVKYVRMANPGDIVVCETDEGRVIKKLTADHKLASLNPDYPFQEKFEDNHVTLIGQVLGTVDPADMVEEE